MLACHWLCCCSQKHNINIIDIDEEKVKRINLGISPIKDDLISEYLATKKPKTSC